MSEKNKYYCADLSDFADEFGVRAEEVLLEKIAAVQQKREVSYYEGVLVPCVRSGVHNKGLRLGCTIIFKTLCHQELQDAITADGQALEKKTAQIQSRDFQVI